MEIWQRNVWAVWVWPTVYPIWPCMVVDADRVLEVESESRVLVIESEDRTMVII